MTYKYYNYKKLRTMENSKKPFSPDLFWEHDIYGLYFVDSTDQKVLLKTTDEGVNVTVVNTAAFEGMNINCGLLDGNILWLSMVNWGVDNHIEVGYIDLANSDNDVSVDTTAPSTSNTTRAWDLFKIGSDIYMYAVETRPASVIVVYDVDTDPFVEKAILVIGGGSREYTLGVVVGTDFFISRSYFPATNSNMFKYNSVGGTITELSFFNNYMIYDTSANVDEERRGATYNNGKMYLSLRGTVDDKWYLIEYDTSGDTYVVKGEHHIIYMNSENVHGSDPPFDTQKGFHMTEDKILILTQNPSNGTLISVFDFDNSIIAISDEYAIDSGSILYKLDDLISSILEGLLFHSRNYFPYLEMRFNSDNITIEPQQFIQIIGNLTSSYTNRIFKGQYNFKDDTIGAVPSGWTNDTAAVIYEAWQNHGYVLELTRDGSNPELEQAIADKVSGTVEFYMGADDVTSLSHIRLRHGGSIVIQLSIKDGQLTYYESASYNNIVAIAIDTLYHIRIDFECNAGGYEGLAADKFYVYVNETRYGPYDFNVAVDHVDLIYMINNTAAVYHTYYDAFDYSWETTYAIGDNLEVEEGEPNQVVFEGIAKKPTKGRFQYVLVENQGSEMEYISPRGNKSGRSDEIIVDINNDGAPDGPIYITNGTLANGGAMGLLDLSGAKLYRTVINDLAEHDVFLWNLRPQGALDYNDGTVDSGADIKFDGSGNLDVILQVQAWTVAKLNQIIVNGAINPITGEPYTGIWNDEADQQANGINGITIEDAQLNTGALCQSKADDMGGNESVRTRVRFKFNKTSYGLIQVGQTITFLYDITNYITISEAQFILDKIIMNIKTEVGYAEISSGL